MQFDVAGLWTIRRAFTTGYAGRLPCAFSLCWRVWASQCTCFGGTGVQVPTASPRQKLEKPARRGGVGLCMMKSLGDRTFRICTLAGFWRTDLARFSRFVCSQLRSSLPAAAPSSLTILSKCCFDHFFCCRKKYSA